MAKEATNMNRETVTAAGYRTRIIGVVEAEVPSDGGKWALYCEHLENGEWLNGGIIQDTNKARLAGWIHVKRGNGFTEWCDACIVAHDECGEVK
jgi:hypothetical protein